MDWHLFPEFTGAVHGGGLFLSMDPVISCAEVGLGGCIGSVDMWKGVCGC